MVGRDLVNTAPASSPPQSRAACFVGESTSARADAAIAYRDAGVHTLKGKGRTCGNCGRPTVVVAGVGGLMKSEGLEPPFVGRERELKAGQGPLPRQR